MYHLHIYTRDLRKEDHYIWEYLEKSKTKLIPLFIFNKQQIDKTKSEYYSGSSFRFLLDTLKNLNFMKYCLISSNDELEKLINKIVEKNNIKSISIVQDVTPFAKYRDKKLKDICDKLDLKFIYLDEPRLICKGKTPLTGSGTYYKVYTPFYKAVKQDFKLFNLKEAPKRIHIDNIKLPSEYNTTLSKIRDKYLEDYCPRPIHKGGREEGEKILKTLKRFKEYKTKRDIMEENTTLLSPYLKYGVVSAREVFNIVYKNFGKDHGLIQQLIWRDFYMNIVDEFPKVLEGQVNKKNKNFNDKYDGIKWRKSNKDLKLWQEGKTGFPIVDAAMRQMNQSGWMHNRGRMIVASFLTKDLQIDWKEGERYFATRLTDYDPCNNNGGWQWAAGTGTDAQPYFRIFNPWTQSAKFDPNAEYIKKWIPELMEIPSKDLHNWNKTYNKYDRINYPSPMVDHSKERDNALNMFKSQMNRSQE